MNVVTEQTVSPVENARCELAAAFRLAAREDLHEGIDNHFSCDLGDGTFLVNRWGVHWSRMTRSDVLRVDYHGRVVDGQGTVETTALQIHSAIHKRHPQARAVLHTHMPYATALACCKDAELQPVSQVSLMFYGQVAYDREYGGLADGAAEGERLAAALGQKAVLFLANHGVIVTGPTLGIAFHDLYFLERAARLQVLAASTGLPLLLVSAETAQHTFEQIRELDDDKEDYFTVMRGLLDETEPDYRS